MIVSIFYIVLAVLGLSFLIFIHELGHYWMARRVGMRVETFAIGFGRPLYSWERKGVRWQIGWLLFGGYVKIAGQDFENEKDPYSIPDGFFGKSPWDRIKVAFMGPFVNLVFAFLVFGFIWLSGGREKNFSDYTHIIGWVDPHSELYAAGLRPGDEIISYNGQPYQGSKDNLYAAMLSGDEVEVSVQKVDYKTGIKTPALYKIKPYPHPNAVEKGIKSTGILNPANYIIYNTLPGGKENPLPEGSPMQGSGIQYGDRVVWIDGEMVFSGRQVAHLLNDNRVLLTVVHDDKVTLRRVPRVEIQELKLDPQVKEELVDWQYEAHLNGTKIQKLFTIPYNLNNECQVINLVKFIDKDKEEEAFPAHSYSDLESPLQPGDKIVAIDGIPISHSFELLANLQKHQVHVLVERNLPEYANVPWSVADADFDHDVDWKDIHKITQSIGSEAPVTSAGHLHLLKPVVPKMLTEFALTPEKQAWLATEILEQKKEIESIEDPEKRAQALHLLQSKEKELLVGLPSLQDRKVTYNPGPIRMFADVFNEIWRTLIAMVSGLFNPKWLTGPIGIVQVVQNTWMIGTKEALYWIGAISLNLGIINLLPIPVLDGGTIMITFLEMITRKRVPPKTLEKIVIPFAVLLIGFFIYLTFNDVSRIYHDMSHLVRGFWSR
jgi:regulator of sigma E protease